MNNLNNEDSINYGIIYTPNNLVNNILDLIPEKHFKDPKLKWLDIGAGNGAFSLNIFNRLNNNLSNKEHIIEHMLYMVEIYPDHIKELKNLFSEHANIIEQDFLALNNNYSDFDFIVGNPPYNINGKLKTPTNSEDIFLGQEHSNAPKKSLFKNTSLLGKVSQEFGSSLTEK